MRLEGHSCISLCLSRWLQALGVPEVQFIINVCQFLATCPSLLVQHGVIRGLA